MVYGCRAALIVAGDVCTSLTLLRKVFQILQNKFIAVWYTMGNHELYVDSER